MVKLAQVKNTTGFDGPFFESGAYIATLASVEKPETQLYEQETLLWKFNLADPTAPDDLILNTEGNPAELWQYMSNLMGPKAKQRKCVEALLGRALLPEDDIDVDELAGKRCNVMVEEVEKDKNGEKKFYNKITAFTPYTPGGRRRRVNAVPE